MSRKAKEMTPEVTWQEITPGGTIYEAGNAEGFKTEETGEIHEAGKG